MLEGAFDVLLDDDDRRLSCEIRPIWFQTTSV